jgi:hypothetical protein
VPVYYPITGLNPEPICFTRHTLTSCQSAVWLVSISPHNNTLPTAPVAETPVIDVTAFALGVTVPIVPVAEKPVTPNVLDVIVETVPNPDVALSPEVATVLPNAMVTLPTDAVAEEPSTDTVTKGAPQGICPQEPAPQPDIVVDEGT